jgi:predicted nucleic acid-binding protein
MTDLRNAVLIDSNVLLDVITNDPLWADWSMESILSLGKRGKLAINPIIYAETSIGFDSESEIDEYMPGDLLRLDLPYSASFLAGKIFLRYKRSGGTKNSTLPDFYIGAHASVTGMALLSRDSSRYRSYFPEVKLICPD